MAAMVNTGGGTLPRNFQSRKRKGGLFSSFRSKKKGSRPEVASSLVPNGHGFGKDDEDDDSFLMNKLALDDFDCDYQGAGKSGSGAGIGAATNGSVRTGTDTIAGALSPRKPPVASTTSSPYAKVSGAGLPTSLVPRRDADVFRPGERSPRHSSIPAATSTAENLSLQSTSSGNLSHSGSHTTGAMSPSSASYHSESRDSLTPTQDLVDNSALIAYERHLFVRTSIADAWLLDDAMPDRVPKSLDELVNDDRPADGNTSEGEDSSSASDPVVDELSDEFGSPSVVSENLDENFVMEMYRSAKRTSNMRHNSVGAISTPGESEDEGYSPHPTRAVRSSTENLTSTSSELADFRRKHKLTMSNRLMMQSRSQPTSPSLRDNRMQTDLRKIGTLTLSSQSLDKPRLFAARHKVGSSGNLSTGSSTGSVNSTGGVTYINGHRSLMRNATSQQRRLSTSAIGGTVSDPNTPITRPRALTASSGLARRSKSGISTGEGHHGPALAPIAGHTYGTIIPPGGHVRVKSTSKMSVSSDAERLSSSRPLSRVSIPTSPFSPLLSPSPQSKVSAFFVSDRKSSCLYSPPPVDPLSPGKFWGIDFSVEKRQVDFILPSNSSLRLSISGGKSVAQVKALLWAKLGEEGILQANPRLKDMSLYSFKYCYNDNNYELFDELQMMQTLHVWQSWKKRGLLTGMLNVELRREPQAKEKRLIHSISHMTGGGLTKYLQCATPEIDWTRRTLVGVRLAAVRNRDRRLYSMEPEVTTSTIPSHIKETFAAGSGMMTLQVSFMNETATKDIHVPISVTPAEVMSDVMHHFQTEAGAHKAGNCVDNYVLRVCGQRVYIHGDHLLANFAYVRECLSKRQSIKLALVLVVDSEEDEPELFPDEEFVDETCGLSASHHQLTTLNKSHSDVFIMSMWDIGQNFRIRILGLSRLTVGILGRGERIGSVHVEAGIYHGGKPLVGHQKTAETPYRSNPHWHQWIEFSLPTRHLPQAARICFSVMVTVVSNRGRLLRGPLPLYWVNMNVINHRSLLQQGNIALSMWPCANARDSIVLATDAIDGPGGSIGGGGGVDMEDGGSGSRNTVAACSGAEASKCGMQPTGSSAVNSQMFDCPTLTVELDTYAHPVACPSSGWPCSLPQSPTDPSVGNIEQLDKIISNSGIVELKDHEKKLVFHHREFLTRNPKALVKFLESIDWADLQHVQEAHRLLSKWKKIAPEDALELLDFKIADKEIRSLAVSCLETLSNTQLVLYLLQLVQVLKFESNHDSALARFLLKRALNSKRIGHYFFWYLRAEMERPDFRQRYSLLLEAYLRGCGRAMLTQFQKQNAAVIGLNEVARRVKFAESRGENAAPLSELLLEADLPRGFAPVFNSSISLGKLDVGACKIMTSKKKPLWLEFAIDDGSRYCRPTKQMIFKQGDDLRQDMLTLQVIRLMDLLWQNDGLDLFMIPYGCVATGLNSGMIEVVTGAQTIAKIQQEEGGGVFLQKGIAPFKKETVLNWLKKMNPGQEDLTRAVEKFTLSCAGYCVATYVLGIGDRHNDNIMLTPDGNLFHIDFGHFLGNIKYFNIFGKKVKRERLPFILTPDFIYVMNSNKEKDMFPLFQRTCARAFNILRRHANVLINLFAMMKLTGIPELRGTEDLSYLHRVLQPESTDSEAEQTFYRLIEECRANSDSVQANWALHIIGQQLASKGS